LAVEAAKATPRAEPDEAAEIRDDVLDEPVRQAIGWRVAGDGEPLGPGATHGYQQQEQAAKHADRR